MRSRGPLYTMPQFGHGNGRHFKGLVRPGGYPSAEIKGSFFATNDDIGIQNYCHLSAGDLRVLRAVS